MTDRRRAAYRRHSALSLRTALLVGAALPCLLILTLFLTGSRINAGNLDNASASGKYYTSYQVQSGDTLWKIAEQYRGKYDGDTRSFVDEVCRINHLSDSDTIYAGRSICVPYISPAVAVDTP